MKKISLLLALLMLLTAFVSCKGFVPETAEELMEKVDEVMDEIKSYKSTQTTEMTFYVKAGGKSYETKASTEGISLVIDSDEEFYYYQSVEARSEVEELEKEFTMTTLLAYNDGQMYVSNVEEENGVDQHLRGTLSKEAFKEYQEELLDKLYDGEERPDFADCATKSFEETEDGEWLLKLSGYTKKTIDLLWKQLDIGEMVDLEVEDMQIEVLIDEDFRAKKLDLEVVFAKDEDEEDLPKIHATMEFSDFDEVTKITDTLKAEDYEEVDDILIISSLQDLLTDVEEKESGEFKLDATATYRGNTSSEYNTVSYGTKDGKFYYDIVSVSPAARMTIKYKDGKQTVTMVGGGTNTTTQSEDTAKNAVKSFFNKIKYDSGAVTDVEVLDDGSIVLTCDNLNPDSYDYLLSGTGYDCASATQEITVKVKDGKLQEFTCEIKAVTERTSYEMDYTIKLTVVE